MISQSRLFRRAFSIDLRKKGWRARNAIPPSLLAATAGVGLLYLIDGEYGERYDDLLPPANTALCKEAAADRGEHLLSRRV